MTNALVLDPFFSIDDLVGFTNAALKLRGWNFNRLNFFDSQSDPVAYVEKILSSIERAEIILCFGDYFWFDFCGDTPAFSDLIEKKLSSGVPFFLEIPRIADRLMGYRTSVNLQKFLRRLGVMPTRNRIFSFLDAHSDHESGASCWFKREDECLMNPQILAGIDKLLVTSGNELEYVEDVFPVVQIGRTHVLVDEGDLLVRSLPGHRPSVAVERRTESEFALIFSGEIAKDTRTTSGGLLHGFSENEKVISRIIEHLARSIDTPDRRSLIAYEKVDREERVHAL